MSLQHHPDRNGGSQHSAAAFLKITQAYNTLTATETGRESCTSIVPAGGAGVEGKDATGALDPHPVPPPMKQGPPAAIAHVLDVPLAAIMTGTSLPLRVERRVWDGGVETPETETVYVSIPRGTDDNEIIIVRGKGHMSPDGQSGDVKVRIRMVEVAPFERHGLNLAYTHTLTLCEALCGFEFELAHPNGATYTIQNEAVVAPDSSKIIPRLGVPRGDITGHLVVQFAVAFPRALTPGQKARVRSIWNERE